MSDARKPMVDLELMSDRKYDKTRRTPTRSLTLRPYQDRAVDAVVTAWASDPRVCLALPTGAGKTVVAAGLIRTAQAEGMRVAFVTDRLTLIPQTIRMFESAGLRCAVVQGDNTSGPGEQSAAHVVICSAQTLDARHIDPNDLDVVMTIVDECHVERAVVARWLDMGVCMCGLTATPLARWMPESLETTHLPGDHSRGYR